MQDIDPPKNFKPKYRKLKKPNFLAKFLHRLRDPLEKKRKAIKKKGGAKPIFGIDFSSEPKKTYTGKAMEWQSISPRSVILTPPKRGKNLKNKENTKKEKFSTLSGRSNDNIYSSSAHTAGRKSRSAPYDEDNEEALAAFNLSPERIPKGRFSTLSGRSNINDMEKFSTSSGQKRPRSISYGLAVFAFLAALFFVLIYFNRDRIPWIDYINYLKKLKHNVSRSLTNPTNLSFSPKKDDSLATIAHFARQNKDRTEILAVQNNGTENIIFSFVGNSLGNDSLSLSENYFAYIDSKGAKLYSFENKQTDLMIAGTQISIPTKVYIPKSEDYIAIFTKEKSKSRLFFYSVKSSVLQERNFYADNLVFGKKNMTYFGSDIGLYYYDFVKNAGEIKITDFDNPILNFYRQGNDLYFITGGRRQISLWQINETNLTAQKIADFNLTFDYTLADFGLAKDKDTIYISLAGQTLSVNSQTKAKQDYTFPFSLYQLLGYNADTDLFFALQRPQGLAEFSLIAFHLNDLKPTYTSSIESSIVYITQ